MKHNWTLMLLAASVFSAHSHAADPALESEVRLLFATGSWDRALEVLEKSPASKTDPDVRELLAMAYVYTGSRIDMMANRQKGFALMRDFVKEGRRARLFASLGQDNKKEGHLVESAPGELFIDQNTVEFVPYDSDSPPAKWNRSVITACGLSLKYGASSNSFYLATGVGKARSESTLRPWQNSKEESEFVCSLLGKDNIPAESVSADKSPDKPAEPVTEKQDAGSKKKGKGK